MAIWIASYPDGTWRDMIDGVRERRRLPLESWFVNRLKAVGGDGIANKVLVATPGSPPSGDGFIVRCLARVEHSDRDEHWRSWKSLFSSEALFPKSYFGCDPADCYSLSVSDVRMCVCKEVVHSCWTHEQTHISRRNYDGAKRTDACLRKITHGLHLCFADWGGSAGEVQMRSSADSIPWCWSGEVWKPDNDAAMLSDDSPVAMPSSDGDAMVSDSDTDAVGHSCRDLDASQVLREWGAQHAAHDIPTLLLPEPIAFLLAHGQWHQLLVLTRWHQDLVNQKGDSLWRNKVLFDSIAWPPSDSTTWQNVGMSTSQMDLDAAQEDAATTPMNAQELL
jgi:hypothetical protein